MINCKKCYCFIILLCAANIALYAQKDSANTITLKLDKENTVHVQMPPGKNSFGWKDVISLSPYAGIIITLIVLWIEIKARRADDKKKNQLERINKQISEFYVPLHALYEKGDRNYYSFLDLFGEPVNFDNPNFKNWAFSVFIYTNTSMRDIIIKKADLMVGTEIPECLLQFSHWADAFKIYLEAHSQKDFDNAAWQHILQAIPHPQMSMQAYLTASVEVLKEKQNQLLTGKIEKIDESEINDLITHAIPGSAKKLERGKKEFWEKLKERQSQKPASVAKSNHTQYTCLKYAFVVALIVLMKFKKHRKINKPISG